MKSKLSARTRFFSYCRLALARKAGRSRRSVGSSFYVEQLEPRIAPATTVSFSAGVLTFEGTGASDHLVLRATGTADLVEYDATSSGSYTAKAGVKQVVFNAGDGDDQLVLLHAAGNLLALQFGITFQAGTGQDLLSLSDGAAGFAGTYEPGAAGTGLLSYQSGGPAPERLNFSGLETVNDLTVASSFTLQGGNAGGEVFRVADGPKLTSTFNSGTGPVLLDGGDRDEAGDFFGGVNRNGWKIIEEGLEYVTGHSFNPGAIKDVLVIGATSGNATAAVQSAATALGLGLTFVSGTAIETVNLSQYRAIYVPSDSGSLPLSDGGITPVDLARLATRGPAVDAFIRSGGGVFALTEYGATGAYDWLSVAGYDFPLADPTEDQQQVQTPNLAAAGMQLSNQELTAASPIQNVFTGGNFHGLEVFVTNSTGEAVILGQSDTNVIAPGGQTAQLTVSSGGAKVNFANKSLVTLFSGSGSDTFDVNLATRPDGLSSLALRTGSSLGSPGLDPVVMLLQATPAGAGTLGFGGNSADDFRLGDLGKSMDGILGSISLSAGGGNDQLAINDDGDSGANDYTISPAALARTGAASVALSGFESLTVNAGAGANAFDVTPATTGEGTLITVHAAAPLLPGGDELFYHGSGALVLGGAIGSGTISQSGHRDVVFTSIETMGATGMLGTLSVGADFYSAGVAADGVPDAFEIRGMGERFELYLNSVFVFGGRIDSFQRIDFAGSVDNDTLTVDSTGGALDFSDRVQFDGAGGRDLLILKGGSAFSDVYSPGPVLGTGSSVLRFGDPNGVFQTERVYFTGLEPVLDTVAGPLTVVAGDADNAISYGPGVLNPAFGRVAVDAQESIEFTGKTALTLQAGAGTDVISLRHPGTPPGLISLFVLGGDPSAFLDTVILSGTSGADALVFRPTTPGSGTVTGLGGITYSFSDLSQLQIDGQGGGDALTVTTPSGAQTISLTPGAAGDAGAVEIAGGAPSGFLPLAFANLGTSGNLTFADASGLRADTLRYFGTAGSDFFTVSASGAVGLGSGRIPMLTPGVGILAALGLDGDDSLAVPVGQPFSRIDWEGGAGADAAVVTGRAVADAFNISASGTVSGSIGLLTLPGVERLTIAGGSVSADVFNLAGGAITASLQAISISGAAGSTLTANGSALSGEALTIFPTDDGGGTLGWAAASARITFAGLTGGVTLGTGGGAGETLMLEGSAGADSFAVSDAYVDGVELVPITHAGFASLRLIGKEGADTWFVTPSLTTAISVEGNDPVGGGSNRVTLDSEALGLALFPGTEAGEGSFVVTGRQPVSFHGLGAATVLNTGALLVHGTTGGDSIHAAGLGESTIRVAVNAGPEFVYGGVSTLTLSGNGGVDQIMVGGFSSANALGGVVVVGDTAADDHLTVTGLAGTFDRLATTPTGRGAGAVANPGRPTIAFSGVAALTLAGQSPDNDAVSFDDTAGNDTFEVAPGVAGSGSLTGFVSGAGGYTFVPAQYSGFTGEVGIARTSGTGSGANTLIIGGSAADDTFSLARSVPTVAAVTLNNSTPILINALFSTLELRGLDGNDTFNFNALAPAVFGGTVRVLGGDSDAAGDTLLYTANTNAATTIDLATAAITSTGTPTLTFSGLERVHQVSAGATSALTIAGTTGADAFSYTPSGATAGKLEHAGSPVVTFTGVGAPFTLDSRTGADVVTVAGSGLADAITIVRGVTTTVQVNGTKTARLTGSGTFLLAVESGLGDDAISISGIGGPDLRIDGGISNGADTVAVTLSTSGVTFLDDAALTTPDGHLGFTSIESVTLTGTAAGANTLFVSGTAGADDVLLTNGGTANTIRVNARPVFFFSNFGTVQLDALAGDDRFTVDPVPLTGVTTVTVQGSAGANALTVLGTSLAQVVTVTPTDAAGGTIKITGAANVMFGNFATTSYDGLSGGDDVTFNTPAGADELTVTPGALPGNTLLQITSAGASVPVTLTNLGGAGTIKLGNSGAARADDVIYFGTALNDTFGVAAATGVLTLGSRNPINPSGASQVRIEGGSGNDSFAVGANLPFAVLNLRAGAGNDVATFMGASGMEMLALDVGAESLTGLGGTIYFSGTESVSLHGGAVLGDIFTLAGGVIAGDLQAIDIAGTAGSTLTATGSTLGSETLTVSPLSGGGGTLAWAGASARISFAGITGGVTLGTGGGAGETLIVEGTAGADSFVVSDTQANGAGLVRIAHAGFASLRLIGKDGADTWEVTPSATLAISVEADDPLGGGSDQVTLQGGSLGLAVFPGTLVGEGSFLVNGRRPVSFHGLSGATVLNAGALLVHGTANGDSLTANGLGAGTISVLVNAGPAFVYSAVSTLTLSGNGGVDEIMVGGFSSANALGGVVVVGDTAADDHLTVTGLAGTFDRLATTPTGRGAGTVDNPGRPTITFSGVAALNLIGQSVDGDMVSLDDTAGDDTFVMAPGALGSGSLTGFVGGVGGYAFVPVQYSGFTGEVGISMTAGTGNGANTLIVGGSAADDTFSIARSGATVASLTLNAGTPVLVNALFSTLELRGLDGNDTFNFNALAPAVFGGTVRVLGGDSDAAGDTLLYTANTNAATTIDLATAAITSTGTPTLTFSGLERVNQVSAGATSALTIAGTTGADAFTYTPSGATAGKLEHAGSPVVTFTGVGAPFTLDSRTGADVVTVAGSGLADAITIVRGVTTTVQVNGTKTARLTGSGTFLLAVESGLGDDAISISGTGGPDLLIDGGAGNGADTLAVTLSTTGVTSLDDAALTTPDGHVGFTSVESVTLTGTAAGSNTLFVSGTAGADDVLLTNGGTANTIRVNARPVFLFNNFGAVQFDTLAGDDRLTVNPVPLTGVTTVTIEGGAGENTLTVLGTSLAEAVTITPTGTAAGTIKIAGAANVLFGGVGAAGYDGLGGGDDATFNTPAGADELTVTPGALPGYTLLQITSAGASVPVTVTNLAATGAIKLGNTGGARADQVVYLGHALDDTFGMAAVTGVLTLGNRNPIDPLGASQVRLEGGSGDDTFAVGANLPFTVLDLRGEAGNDAVTFMGTSGMETLSFDLGAESLTGLGGTIFFSGTESVVMDSGAGLDDVTVKNLGALGGDLERLNVVSAGGAALTVRATTGSDADIFVPTGAAAGGFNSSAGGATVGFSGIGGKLTFDGQAGSDTLVVRGTAGADDIAATGTLVTVGTFKKVDYLSVEALRIEAREGSDMITVTAAAAVPIFVDGGDPVGIAPGDQLVLKAGGATMFQLGPETDEGALIEAGREPVSFDHLEGVTIDGAPIAVVLGTPGDDDITVMARHVSTHAGADGAQDFTVMVRDSVEVLFLNTPVLFVDALGGDDDVIFRAPAPNGASWNVQATIVGGPAATGIGSRGDRFSFENTGAHSAEESTPGVTYTPAGGDRGAFLLGQAAPSLMTLASSFAVPELGYASSTGGFGRAEFDGHGSAGAFTIVGTAVADAITHTPGATADSGRLAVGDLLPVDYENLGSAVLKVDGAAGVDTLSALGTEANDALGLNAAGHVFAAGRLSILPLNVEHLVVRGLGGDDALSVTAPAGGQLFQTITLDGGTHASGDVATLDGNGADATVAFGAANGAAGVTGGGLAVGGLTILGTEALNLNARAGKISIAGSSEPDFFDATPRTATGATIFAEGSAPVLHTDNSGMLTFTAGKSLMVHGTVADDLITITRGANSQVLVGALKLINLTAATVPVLNVRGEAGADVVEVRGAGGPALTVGGGDPFVRSGGDTVRVFASGGQSQSIFTVTQGATTDSGAIRLGSDVTQFQGIEHVALNAGGGAGADSATVTANDADNAILVTVLGGGGATVTSDAQPAVSFEAFSPGSAITVQSLAGDDALAVVIATSAASSFTSINIAAGQPSGGDTLTVNAVPLHDDALQLQPAGTGAGVLTDNSAAFPVLNFTGVEHLALVGQGGIEHDALLENFAAGNNTIEITPGSSPDAGTITGFAFGSAGEFAFVPVEFRGFLGFVAAPTAIPQEGMHTLIVNGTAAADTFQFGSAPAFSSQFPAIVVNTGANAHTPIYFSSGLSRVILRGLAGDDAFDFAFDPANASAPVIITVEGGGAGDVLTHTAVAGAETVIDIEGTIISTGANLVEFNGIEVLVQRSSGPGSTLRVLGTAGQDNLEVTPTAEGAGGIEAGGSYPSVHFSGLRGALTIDSLGGADSVTVHGSAGADAIAMTRGVQTVVAVNGFMPVQIETASAEAIAINGGLGNDAFTISGSYGLLSGPHGALTIDGGGHADTLTVYAATGLTTVVPGAMPDAGEVNGPQGSRLAFHAIESLRIEGTNPLLDTLAIEGTSAADAFAAFVAGAVNRITVNDRVATDFAGFATVRLEGRAGDDVFNVLPVGLSVGAIEVRGGEAAGGDRLVVSGTAAAEGIELRSLSADSGIVTIAGTAPISLSGAAVTIHGLGGGDALTVVTPRGTQEVRVAGGAAADAGDVVGDALVPLHFDGLGLSGSLAMTDLDGGRADRLIYSGTEADDLFTVSGHAVALGGRLVLTAPGAATLDLRGLGGSDTFVLAGTGVFGTVRLEGSGSDANVANFSGDGTLLTAGADHASGSGLGTVSLAGIATVNLANGAGQITIQGTASADDFHAVATGASSARIEVAGVTLSTTNTGAVVIDALAGADAVTIAGNALANVVTVTAGSVTAVAIDGQKVIGVAAAAELLAIETGDGSDFVTLTGAEGAPLSVDLGAGTDTLNAAGFTGHGLSVHGGAGSDTITGSGGADAIFGGDGDDLVTGGPGNDQIFGGDGSDRFIWNPGDASDLIDGEAGVNVLTFNGNAAAEKFAITANGTRVTLSRDLGGVSLDLADIEEIRLGAGGGGDLLSVGDLTSTGVRLIAVDLGAGDLANDQVSVAGREIADVLGASFAGAAIKVTGLRYDVSLTGSAASDTLTLLAGGGNDVLTAAPGVETLIGIVLDGGSGADTITGSGTLLGGDGEDVLTGGAAANILDGGAGNDLLIGGTGANAMFGGAGDDRFVAGPAATSIDGGAGFDTLQVTGTPGADRLEILQTNAGELVQIVNGTMLTHAITALESVQVEAGAGDDLIRVVQADALAATPVASLRVVVEGGASAAGDRLIVVDDGPGDTMIQRPGRFGPEGSVTIDALPAIVYGGVEFVQPVGGTDGLSQVVVMRPDAFEFNDLRSAATHLGIGSAPAGDVAIDSVADAGFGTSADHDFFRVQASSGGKMTFSVYFQTLGSLANGRAGLPGNGNLEIEVLDAAGQHVVTGLETTFGSSASMIVREGEVYYLKVSGATPEAVNAYQVTVASAALPGFPYVGGKATSDGTAFTPAVQYSTGKGTRTVAAGDLNNDGKLDMLTANSGGRTLSVRLGRGDGTFDAPLQFSTRGKVATSMVVGDFNSDGNLDVAAVVRGENRFLLFAGDGEGRLGAPVLHKVLGARGAMALRAADLTGDGRLDLVAASAASNTVSVLAGNGAGGFGKAVNFATGGRFAHDLALGDFDGDGNLDAGVANLRSNSVSVLWGDGAGSFGPATRFAAGGVPLALTAGDFNGDGRADLAVANGSASYTTMLLGAGTRGSLAFEGQAQAHSGGSGAARPRTIAVGDFDVDGKLDLVLTTESGRDVRVLLGNGNGTFIAPFTFATGLHHARAPLALLVADLNGDGLSDLLVANPGASKVSVLLRRTDA